MIDTTTHNCGEYTAQTDDREVKSRITVVNTVDLVSHRWEDFSVFPPEAYTVGASLAKTETLVLIQERKNENYINNNFHKC